MSILNNRFGHSEFAFDPAPPFSNTCFRERIEEEDRYLTEKTGRNIDYEREQ